MCKSQGNFGASGARSFRDRARRGAGVSLQQGKKQGRRKFSRGIEADCHLRLPRIKCRELAPKSRRISMRSVRRRDGGSLRQVPFRDGLRGPIFKLQALRLSRSQSYYARSVTGRAIAKMALHGFAHIGAQFGQRIGLGEDVVSQRCGRIAAIGLVFVHFKYDFRVQRAFSGCVQVSLLPAKALPECDFRYFSNSSASYFPGNAQYQAITHGRYFAVCGDLPEL